MVKVKGQSFNLASRSFAAIIQLILCLPGSYCFVPFQLERTTAKTWNDTFSSRQHLLDKGSQQQQIHRIATTTTTSTSLSTLPQTFGEWLSRPLVWVILLNLLAAVYTQLKIITSKWDDRLNLAVNLIFALFPNKMEISSKAASTLASNEDKDSDAMKAHVNELRNLFVNDMKNLPSVSVGRILDVSVPRSDGNEVTIRLYYPPTQEEEDCNASSPSPSSLLPWIFYCHGGGWVMGNIESHDAFCRQLSKRSGVVVASVEYRLAPEFQHPIPRNDCYDALKGLFENSNKYGLDPNRIGIAGDGSGGTIAAQVAILLQADSAAPSTTSSSSNIKNTTQTTKIPPLRIQVLFCPALDPGCRTLSYEENGMVPGLFAKDMKWLWKRHLPKSYYRGDFAERDANLLQVTNLSGSKFAPAFIVAAECDVLRDEAKLYSLRLEDAGVPVCYKCYKGAIHAFCVYANTPLSLGDIALDDAVVAIQEAMK